jgi:hypothetical protein
LTALGTSRLGQTILLQLQQAVRNSQIEVPTSPQIPGSEYMKPRPSTYKLLGITVALLALLAVVPSPASAQLVPAGCDVTGIANLSVSIPADERPITPITGVRTITATVTYTAVQQASSITPVEVTVRARAQDAWATVTVGKSNFFVNIEANAPTRQAEPIPLTITLNRNAPAFQDTKITVEAEASEGTCVTAAEGDGEQTIKAGFYEQYSARFERLVWPAGQNSQIQIPTTIENFGNGAITVFLNNPQNGEADRGARGLVVTPPSGQVIVESDKQGGSRTTVTVNVEVQTPFKNGYENRRDAIAVQVTGTSTDQRDITLNAVVQTQGVYVPGFEAAALLTALLGVAMLQMRRRL